MVLQVMVATALIDAEFCRRLLNGQRHIVVNEFDLTEEERAFVQTIKANSIQEFAAQLDEWLQTQEGNYAVYTRIQT
jgi:hypothetical protein